MVRLLRLVHREARARRVLRWLHSGPPAARVDDVSVRTETSQGEHGFSVR